MSDVPTNHTDAHSERSPAHSPSTLTRVDLRTELPDGLCPGCLSILYRDDTICLECGGGIPPAGWPPLEEFEDPWLGRSLAGRWLVSRRLGKGATSSVYRADSLRVPRRFAVKIIDIEAGPGRADEVRARARTEVSVVQSAENPHVVGIHEMFEPTSRHIAIVMEYVEGVDLHEVLRREGAMSPDRVVSILRQVAEGLRSVHAAEVVHRDIKPSNILLESLPDGTEQARLTDFGIAHAPDTRDKPGGFIGTPLYSSPEQIVGDCVDHRSDIYSLGALAYHLLTGTPPFMRDTYLEVMRAQVSIKPPRLEDAGPRRFSEPLEALIARILRKRITERPQSIDELIGLLDDLAAHDDWDQVSLREASGASVVQGEAPTRRRQGASRGHCMVPVSIAGAQGVAGRAALAGGRVIAATDSEIILTTLVPRRRFVRGLELGAATSALGLSADCLSIGLQDGRVAFIDVGGDWDDRFRDPRGRAVTGVATDGAHRVAVVGTSAGDMHLLDGRDNQVIATIHGHPVTAVAVSNDGRRFAVARGGRGVSVYDVSSPGAPIATIPREEVTSLALSEHGDRLATGQATGMATVWTVPGEVALHASGRDRGELLSVSFADDTLMGVVRQGDEAFLVDLGCRFGGVCAPDCTRCHLQ